MKIREANSEDAPEIQQLLIELTQDNNVCVLGKQIDAIKNNKDSFLLVAELEKNVVGTAQITLCPDVMYKDQPYAIVENIVVKSEYCRQGIGKALLTKVDDMAKINKCSKIMLLSSSDRHTAHKFFESAGYLSTIKKGFVKYGSKIK